jgi:ring-1,2-phenylacetyl-CoA epoxidase subunit PaaD
VSITITAGDVSLKGAVRAAVAAVNDPEYPDVSIVDLGLLESIRVEFATEHEVSAAVAHVGLIPTFSGCPALKMIADDVRRSVESLESIDRCVVSWLAGPVWDSSRLTAPAQSRLAEEYTVVLRRKDGSLLCPVCGSDAVVDQAMAGPTRCRSVAWCPSCRNPVEVMRS